MSPPDSVHLNLMPVGGIRIHLFTSHSRVRLWWWEPVQIFKEHPRYDLTRTDICHLVKKKKAANATEESLYLMVYENVSLVIPFVTAISFSPAQVWCIPRESVRECVSGYYILLNWGCACCLTCTVVLKLYKLCMTGELKASGCQMFRRLLMFVRNWWTFQEQEHSGSSILI